MGAVISVACAYVHRSLKGVGGNMRGWACLVLDSGSFLARLLTFVFRKSGTVPTPELYFPIIQCSPVCKLETKLKFVLSPARSAFADWLQLIWKNRVGDTTPKQNNEPTGSRCWQYLSMNRNFIWQLMLKYI